MRKFMSDNDVTGYHPGSNYTISSGKGTSSRPDHAGTDFSGPHGALVPAADGGVVTGIIRGHSQYGNAVVVDHGVDPNSNPPNARVLTLYAHMSSINVGLGDPITSGQSLGENGSTGRSTGPHIHAELLRIPPGSEYYNWASEDNQLDVSGAESKTGIPGGVYRFDITDATYWNGREPYNGMELQSNNPDINMAGFDGPEVSSLNINQILFSDNENSLFNGIGELFTQNDVVTVNADKDNGNTFNIWNC
jgi:murein DD-endopeptidase MepM/ murein hydrolase activator NlpD